MTDVIPDCLFIRDFEAEKAGGFTLAGMLFVRRRPHEMKKKDKKRIARVIQRVTSAVRENPDLNRAVCNLDGSETSIGDKLRDDEWLHQQYAPPPNNPYTTITVRVDPRPNDGYLRLSDYDLKQIMGSH